MKREPSITKRLAARVRGLRERQGLTQAALARQAGLSRSQVLALERGERASTVVTLEIVARALGVTPGDLLQGPATTRPDGDPDRADKLAARLRALGTSSVAAVEQVITALEELAAAGKHASSRG